MIVIVNMSDAKTSRNPAEVLATYALGSCIGVTLYDPVAAVGGMLHFQLPTSALDPARARTDPAMFADTGMSALLQGLAGLGARKQSLRVGLAGAARMLSGAGPFQIGKRNHAAIRKLLWQHGLLIQTEDVGGTVSRNLFLSIADGSVVIRKSDWAPSAEPAGASLEQVKP